MRSFVALMTLAAGLGTAPSTAPLQFGRCPLAAPSAANDDASDVSHRREDRRHRLPSGPVAVDADGTVYVGLEPFAADIEIRARYASFAEWLLVTDAARDGHQPIIYTPAAGRAV